jgi:hypothetical protein
MLDHPVLKHIHQYSLQDLYPTLEETTLRIFLTIPVTTATCETSFSKLKNSKKLSKINIKLKLYDYIVHRKRYSEENLI